MILEEKILPSGNIVVCRTGLTVEVKYFWAFKDGPIHNEGGIAIQYRNGDYSWVHYGVLHRLDGPASLYKNKQSFYINNIKYLEKDYWKRPEVIEYKYLQEHPELKAFI